MPDAERPLLPLLDDPPRQRRDAARNRDAVLQAALCLVAREGAPAVTMESVAEAAGVGKGTVFRRFGNRQGLMAEVLHQSELEWQASVIGGEPPLGPGAEPLARLLAFGRSRLELNLRHADLIEAAAGGDRRSHPAWAFAALHVRHLLGECGVAGDLPLLATALLAPLDVTIVRQQLREGYPADRIVAAWSDLARRVAAAAD
ncbi:TetR/AcrR family transcriptional regulator [Nocardioides daejeonensis]|uniref:TetR/AcrR family transcriptional regulator n=1 Tax=Nocardioides daejeonensis TaxID=1046556 RepID=UPI000D74BA79|nr:TetR/AcrR family transcriptional regulator [Nocardioides daejeonensis]